MIDTVEIMITNGVLETIRALVIYDKQIVYLNDKKYIVNHNFLERLTMILCGFEREYGTSKMIDAEEFNISVMSNAKTEVYHGKGFFPTSYVELKDLLGDLYD